MDLDRLYLAYGALLRAFYERGTPDAVLDAGIREILALEGNDPGPDVSHVGSLDAAMGLIPYGSWFHWNHFGFGYVPNVPVPGVPMTNAADYRERDGLGGGRPVEYESMATDSAESRRRLPRHVCQAVFMARRTPIAKALAKRDDRPYLVQTGHGPLLAMPDGKLREIPSGRYFTVDGRLIDKDPEIHGHASMEDPHA